MVGQTQQPAARTVAWTIELDALSAAVLATSAAQQGLLAAELAALILYQAAAVRVGWPGMDGKGLRTAWRDWMSGRPADVAGEGETW